MQRNNWYNSGLKLKTLNYKFINTFRNLALASNPDFKRIGEVLFYKDLLKILDDK